MSIFLGLLADHGSNKVQNVAVLKGEEDSNHQTQNI